MPRRSRQKEREAEPQSGTSGRLTLAVRILLEATLIGAIVLGLFHWAYNSAPLPVTLAAIVAIIIAATTDYFWFGRQRGRAG